MLDAAVEGQEVSGDCERHGRVRVLSSSRLFQSARSRATLGYLASAAGVAAIGVWAISPRFSLSRPSLYDDWFAIVYSSPAVHQLLHGHYDSSVIDFGGRYRPAYAVWNFLQWHVPPHGSSMLWPNVWAVGRLLLFMVAIAGTAAVLSRGRMPRQWLFGLAVCASLAVTLSPGVTLTLAQFPTEEPLTIAGIAVGLLLVGWATTRIGSQSVGMRPRLVTTGAYVLGFLLYLFGIFMKESSLATFVLLPFYYMFLRGSRHPNEASLRARQRVAGLTTLTLSVPLVFLAVQFGRVLSSSGILHHGNARQSPLAGLGDAALLVVRGAFSGLGTPIWFVAIVIAATAWLREARRREVRALLAVGILASCLLSSLIDNLASAGSTRYFVPLAVAGAVTTPALMARVSARSRVYLLACCAGMIFLANLHAPLRAWMQTEAAGAAAVDSAAAASQTACPVYLSDFAPTRRIGVARLLGTAHPRPRPRCDANSTTAFDIVWGDMKSAHLVPGCETDWRSITTTTDLRMLECDRFHEREVLPDQDVKSLDQKIVRLAPSHDLVPASHLMDVATFRSR